MSALWPLKLPRTLQGSIDDASPSAPVSALWPLKLPQTLQGSIEDKAWSEIINDPRPNPCVKPVAVNRRVSIGIDYGRMTIYAAYENWHIALPMIEKELIQLDLLKSVICKLNVMVMRIKKKPSSSATGCPGHYCRWQKEVPDWDSGIEPKSRRLETDYPALHAVMAHINKTRADAMANHATYTDWMESDTEAAVQAAALITEQGES